MRIDTGATCSVLDYGFFLHLKQHSSLKLGLVQVEGLKIKTVGDKILKAKGSLFVNVCWLRNGVLRLNAI